MTENENIDGLEKSAEFGTDLSRFIKSLQCFADDFNAGVHFAQLADHGTQILSGYSNDELCNIRNDITEKSMAAISQYLSENPHITCFLQTVIEDSKTLSPHAAETPRHEQ